MQSYHLKIKEKSYAIFVSTPEAFIARLIEQFRNKANGQRNEELSVTYLGQEFILKDIVKINKRQNKRSKTLTATINQDETYSFFNFDKRNFRFTRKIPEHLQAVLAKQQVLYQAVVDKTVGDLIGFDEINTLQLEKKDLFDYLDYLFESKILEMNYRVNPELNLDAPDWASELPLMKTFKNKETGVEHKVGMEDVSVSLRRI